MHLRLEARLRYLKHRYGNVLLTVLTVLLLLMMFVLAPLQPTGIVAFQLLGLVTGILLIGIALVVSGNSVAFSILLVAFSVNVTVVILRRLYDPAPIHLYLVASAWLILAMTLGWVVARAVFGPGRVDVHRIIGSVLLYLLIALTFSALFIFAGLSLPNAFSGLVIEDSHTLSSSLFYFSFVTLTSTGYGDIYPIHPIARSLCNVETILGQLYPATLLARLVTLEIEGRG
jgi:hypothetical protein